MHKIGHFGSNMHTAVPIKCIDFVILFQPRLTLYGLRMQRSHSSSKQVRMYDAVCRVQFVQICMYTLFLTFLFIILNFEPINGLCKQKKINFINTGDPYYSLWACKCLLLFYFPLIIM